MRKLRMKPVIGIVLDYVIKKKDEGGYANFPWYALRYHYARAIKDSGGMPITLTYEADLIDDYLQLCDGILIPGGNSDIPPKYYGESIAVENISIMPDTSRIDFELELICEAIDAAIPIFGICAGHQSLNVALGGTLYQDIKTQLATNIEHCPSSSPRGEGKNFHDIKVEPNTLLHSITGKEIYKVNTFHHQAIKSLGRGLIVSAKSPDSIIESIEHSALPFCLGVEWHPEFLDCQEDLLLFRAFVEAARQYHATYKSLQ